MESTTYSNESGKDIARTRYVWLDYSKVLCIAGVVYGHCVADVLSSYIFLFHVPIFFIISGILYRPKRYIDTLKSLFVPVLLFSLCTLSMAFIRHLESRTRLVVRDYGDGVCDGTLLL